jgi:hypothetical protein
MDVTPYWAAFAFPFRRENAGPLILGLFLLTFIPAGLSAVPIGGGAIRSVLDLLLTGYYAVFLQSILQSSMAGDDRMPGWPEFSSPVELLEDFLIIVTPFVVSFLPLILLHGFAAGFASLYSADFLVRSAVPGVLAEGSTSRIGLEIPLILVGWLYLPMAVLAGTFFGALSILNPVAVAKAVWSVGPSYLGVAAAIGAMVTAAWAVSLIPGRFLTSFGSSLLVFYTLIVALRLLGAHYRLNRERLGWERIQVEPV